MADTLQDYLVSLKYHAEGGQRFVSDIEKTERSAMSLGKGLLDLGKIVAQVGTGLALGVAKYAQGMEQIGFVAARTGTTVKHLKSLELAGASLGSSTEGARSSIEGLAAFMRNTPGSSQFLAGIGVQTQDAKGHALDTVKVMGQLAQKLRAMPVYQANQYAQLLGISDNMMLAMRTPDFDKQYQKYEQTYKGGHLDQTAASSHQGMDALRVLSAKKDKLESLAAGPVIDAFVNADQTTGGVSTEIGGAAVAMTSLGTAAMVAKKGLSLLAPAAEKGAEKGILKGAEKGAAAGAARFMPWLGRVLAPLAGMEMMLHTESLNKGEGSVLLKRRQSHYIRLFEKLGMTHNEAIGTVANLTQESQLQPTARGDKNKITGEYEAYGLAQWHAPRRKHFKQLYGKDIRKASGDEQAAFLVAEMHSTEAGGWKKVQAAARISPEAAARAFSTYIERPADKVGEAHKRAGIAQTINNNTNIHVHGSDAHTTAKRVAEHQKRVNQLNARNTAGAVR